jgi:hypothetical protein
MRRRRPTARIDHIEEAEVRPYASDVVHMWCKPLFCRLNTYVYLQELWCAILGLNQWQTATCARANVVAARRIRFPMVLQKEGVSI